MRDKSGNRRVDSSRLGARRKRRKSLSTAAAGGKSSRSRGSSARRPSKPPLEPHERRARNRTYLIIAILVIVNIWVFTGENGLGKLQPKATSIALTRNLHGGLAQAPEDACSGDPVRIFSGLSGQVTQSTRLREGKTLRLALLELGLAGGDIESAEASLREGTDLGLLTGSGAPVRVATDRRGDLQALEVEISDGHLLQACRSPEGMQARSRQHPLRSELTAISLRIPHGGGLAEAVRQAGEYPELATRVARGLAFDIDFMVEARPQDRIEVLVEKRYLGRSFHRYGPLLAVRYRGAAGRVAYYDANMSGEGAGMYSWEGRPMRRPRLRSPVGWYPGNPEARGVLKPYLEFVAGRVGAQYRRPLGAPVLALVSGEISFYGVAGEEGLVLEIKQPSGAKVRYAHLHRGVRDYQIGDFVEQGEVVALVGKSGRTPRSRLRVELYESDGTLIDPLAPEALPTRGGSDSLEAGLVGDQLAGFRARVKDWRQALRRAGR